MRPGIHLAGLDLSLLNNEEEELQGLDWSVEEVTQVKAFQRGENGELVLQG